jgi:hypothetical protein
VSHLIFEGRLQIALDNPQFDVDRPHDFANGFESRRKPSRSRDAKCARDHDGGGRTKLVRKAAGEEAAEWSHPHIKLAQCQFF